MARFKRKRVMHASRSCACLPRDFHTISRTASLFPASFASTFHFIILSFPFRGINFQYQYLREGELIRIEGSREMALETDRNAALSPVAPLAPVTLERNVRSDLETFMPKPCKLLSPLLCYTCTCSVLLFANNDFFFRESIVLI